MLCFVGKCKEASVVTVVDRTMDSSLFAPPGAFGTFKEEVLLIELFSE
jgi:hypothetical protein